jgi:hypothetical protein
MSIVVRLLLVVVYVLVLLPARLVNMVLRRDPLQRRPRREQSSYWVLKVLASDVEGYFAQHSPQAGGSSGLAQHLLPLFLLLARFSAPQRLRRKSLSLLSLLEDGVIEDEIYPLW